MSRIVVKALSNVGYDLYAARHGPPNIAPPALLRSLLAKAAADVPGHKFSTHFLFGEWSDVVDAWQLRSWDAYRDMSRLGRKTRIGEWPVPPFDVDDLPDLEGLHVWLNHHCCRLISRTRFRRSFSCMLSTKSGRHDSRDGLIA